MLGYILFKKKKLEELMEELEFHRRQQRDIRKRDLLIIQYRDQAELLHEIVKQVPKLNKRTWDSVIPPWRQRLREQADKIMTTIKEHRDNE